MALADRVRSSSPQQATAGDIVGDYREQLLRAVDIDGLAKLPASERRAVLERELAALLSGEGPVLTARSRSALTRQVLDEALGLGVLEPLLADPTVTEIMVNGHETVFVERGGRVERASTRFASVDQLMQTIDRIVSASNRRVDESSPMVDTRLASGERVNIVVPPLALDGPTITIRRFPHPYSLAELAASGMIDESLIDLFRTAVAGRLNILVSGGTGTGKTTFLNALSSLIADRERIVTIEDAAELSLQQAHVVRLESRPANAEGGGGITIRELVRNALRMRPDRIIVGEVRGGEALDMLQAMNTGHEGSLTTIHANSASDSLSRLETLALMSEVDLPAAVVRDQVSRAIDLIIQLQRQSDGSRRVVEVVRLASAPGEDYRFERIAHYSDGRFVTDASRATKRVAAFDERPMAGEHR